MNCSPLYLRCKRLLDILVSGIGLIVLIVPCSLIALLVCLDSPGSPLFRQLRLGRNGRPFTIYKFRTMRQGSERQGSGIRTSADDPRVTNVGRVLRGASLDELPQLFNVLRGDMSLVGPRPPLTTHPYTFEGYPSQFAARFDVRPGMTGLAQVSGRNTLTWPERLTWDVRYVESISLKGDVSILLRTAAKFASKREVFNLRESEND